jgi:hypothetical protein
MIHFVVPAAHDRMIREYLELWGRDLAPSFRVVHVESLPALTRFPRGTYVLAALDQLPARQATFVAALHDALADRDDVRFLNHPTRTWQRARLLDELHTRGRNAFRAVRISGDLRALRYPVFVRDARSHDGALSPLLDTPAQVEAAIGRMLLQGRSAGDLLVVEFCDTSDADGYYRKYAAFVVGTHVMPRTLSYSREWMLKFQGSEFSRAMAEEEREYVLTNPHEQALAEVFALAGVEYGRIDYSMKDGRLQTWEINLNPTIGRGLRPSTGKVPRELESIRQTSKEYFYGRFRAAWESVGLAAGGHAGVPASIDRAIVEAALASAHAGGGSAAAALGDRWLSTLRRVLRPAKPLIVPLLTPALPVIAWAARRRVRRATGPIDSPRST